MNVLLFGASGMVGKAVLLECCDDPRVESILSVGRSPCGVLHPKLTELQHTDFFDFSSLRSQFASIDACFFCLGVSAAGKSEADYARLTFDLTMAAASVLKEARPDAVFTYVSGAGTDSSERGETMWARVKGRTENALLQMFPKSYMFRPAIIVPMRGVHSKTFPYELFYTAFRPLLPKFPQWFPKQTTTSVALGRAMINVAANGEATRVLETPDINRIGGT